MILYTNNARSTLAAGISAGDTAMTVATGHGDRFPVVVAPDIAYITLENTGGILEIIKCTARASGSDVLTIVRAQNGTAAAAWIAGDTVAHRVIALELGRYETLGNVDDADSKATPVDADYVPLKDSAASNGLKRVTWANVKATLKTYFDALYAKVGAITGGGITMTTARLLGRTTASTGAVEEITVGTGLSLAAGALTCTVTSDVNSVAGETGVITTAELIAALNAGSGLDADTVGGVAASAFAVGTGTTAGDYYHNAPMMGASLTVDNTWQKVLHARVFVTGTIRMRYGMQGGGYNTYCRPYLNGAAVGTQRGPTGVGPLYYTDDIAVTKGDIISLYLYGAATLSYGYVTGYGTGNLDGIPVTGGTAPAAETV